MFYLIVSMFVYLFGMDFFCLFVCFVLLFFFQELDQEQYLLYQQRIFYV